MQFMDSRGNIQAANLAFPYAYGKLGGRPNLPLATIVYLQLLVDDADASGQWLGLDLTTGPHWHLEGPIGPETTVLGLRNATGSPPQPNAQYSQLAVLNWLGYDGYHYSRVVPWEIRTDRNGLPRNGTDKFSTLDRFTSPLTFAWAGLVICFLMTSAYFRRRRNNYQLQKTFDYTFIIAITLWLANYLNPESWFLPTWPTGGDLASHILYADHFREWFFQGQITGWMPEVFAGFPAFRFYFPLPFAFIAVISAILPIQVAIKLVVLAPVLLLPASVYWLGGRFRWPSGARLLSALFSVAFLVHDGSAIWGGNLLAVFAGEFAYSWGILSVLFFWGSLAWALRAGGWRWVIPTLALAATGLSHGYALLIAGFSALLAPLFFSRSFHAVITVLRVHSVTFLLLGFWLIPLFEYLPHTVPNDTSVWAKSFDTFLPSSMIPLLIALPTIPLALRGGGVKSSPLVFLFLVGLMAIAAYSGAFFMGLADIRFFPFAQLSLAIALGGTAGIVLQRWGNESTNWTVSLVSLLLLHYWLSGMQDISVRAEWSLEGYEKKAMWRHYQELADYLGGSIEEPRILFEHAPANNDIGSTRAMEALPLFGSRPVLEGLYMEAALNGPFIYQMQAEASSQPSSPLARFPPVKGTATTLADRLRQFYADTVVIRSEMSAVILRDDPQFHLGAEIGPFKIYHLEDEPQPVELLAGQLETYQGEQPWLEQAFENYILYPPGALTIVDGMDSAEPPDTEIPGSGKIATSVFDDSTIRFRTDFPGKPHLVKMTYDAAWRSVKGEPLYKASPGFILIVPATAEVELVYGKTTGQYLGSWLTVLGFIALLPLFNIEKNSVKPPSRACLAVFFAISAAIVAAVLLHPSWNYQRAYSDFQRGDYVAATEGFENSMPSRHVKAQKAEVRFWAARSAELAGKQERAIQHYRALIEESPASYWAPESLYRLAHIKQARGVLREQNNFALQLTTSFPKNSWARLWLKQDSEPN